MASIDALISPVASLIEPALLRLFRGPNRFPPLFVVGAPRSGTTVVIQHIINSLEFGYFPNLAKWHPRACITFGYLARRRYAYESSYDSAYGVIEGPMAPSDGWDILHRWFPRYQPDRKVDERRLTELRTIVRAYEKIFDAPFANKNNANSLRIPYLRRVFPASYFVYVRRDLCDAALSVMKSREAHNVPPDEWWGIAPPRFHDRAFASELERAVYQTVDVERYIEGALAEHPSSRVYTVAYEDFCEAPDDLIAWIDSAYRSEGVTLGRRERHPPVRFRRSTLPEEERRALEAQIAGIVEQLQRESS